LKLAWSHRSALLSFAIALLMLSVLAGVLHNGRPFDRHRIAVDPNAISDAEQRQLSEQFRHTDEIRFIAIDRAQAESRLRLGMVSAVLSREPGRPAMRLTVGSHNVFFGWGLSAAIAQPVELALLQTSNLGYLHFVFPGLLTFSLLGFSLVGMGRIVREQRAALLLTELADPQRTSSSSLVSRCVRQVLVSLLLTGLLILGARLLFKLPLNMHGAAWLAVLGLAGVLAFSGIGFVVACWVATESTLLKLSQVLLVPLLLLSEALFLLEELPRPLRVAGELLPTTYLVRLLREVVLDSGTDAKRLVLGASILIGLGLVGFLAGFKLLAWRPSAR